MKKENLLIYLLLMFLAASCQNVETYDGPIIDVHMHAFAHDRYGFPPPPNPMTQTVPEAKTNAEAIEHTLKEMARLNIQQAVISGPLAKVRYRNSYQRPRFNFFINM